MSHTEATIVLNVIDKHLLSLKYIPCMSELCKSDVCEFKATQIIIMDSDSPGNYSL